MIVEKILELKKSRINQWPCKSNRASELGHDCERYLVLLRTRWEEKTLHDVVLQSIFDEGNFHERAFITEAMSAGIVVIEQQRAFEYKELNITGHVDLKTLKDGKAIPVEFKSCSPFVFDKLDTIKSLFESDYPHVRKYPAQLTLYMLMDNVDESIFIFKNKLTGMLKEIPMTLDYEFGESLLKKAERINKHVADKTLPDCMKYDDRVCKGCGFIHICLPDIKRDALEIKDDPEIEAKLELHEKLKPAQLEYNSLHDELMKRFRTIEKVVIGDWFITGKKTKTGWKTTISKL